MVQSQDHLAAPEWNWHRNSHWISGTMLHAFGAGTVDRISVQCSEEDRINRE